ncbi:hypothetical protein Bca52824_002120 [Brassica carinata]|uniref:Ubiquitin-like protease family profile domain-containing protein n=1 Tax=Brassica carinata TaxID=52824 RepID=A0A8X8BDI8_BRACI|nr:hypothetical protein Bca52824_002120 [Brassica carinata]
MQEFYAVTGLKFKEEPGVGFITWKNDKGFWATVLKTNRKINLYCVRDELLKVCNEWTYVDRVRFVYLCILQSFVMAKDWKVYIPHEYICLVMDFEKLRMYPWGLRAYDELITSILRAREDVNMKNSYVLDGFSYAFQIWIMEAKNMTKMRCMNWKDSGKVSYHDITSLESHFEKGELFAFISSTGNFDVINSRVPTHVEEPAVVTEEPVVVPKSGKRKLSDLGAESRKKQLLCQRAAEHNSGVSSEMKNFIEGLCTSSFNSFKEIGQKDIHERFDNVANEVAQLKEQVSQIKNLSETVGKGNASEILCPSATLGKEQGQSSYSPNPAAAKGKGNAVASVDPTPVRRSPRPVRQGTQESLQEAMENLSQASHVKGFNPSQQLNGEEQAEWVTPLSSFKPADWRPPTLKDVESHEDRMHDPDYSLVFVHEELWAKLIEWTTTSKELKIGPSMLTSELTSRVMGPTQWLKNHVFDCEGLKHNSAVDPFAVLIPRIVKAVQSSKSRQHNVKQYTVTYASMPFLNKSSSDCGVYALKHIECHLLGLDFSLVNDDNIREARQKIAYDLWEAANDPVLISRMAKFTPPKTISNALVELE